MKKNRQRCWWCADEPLYIKYHDEEWGIPEHDERNLFEILILEGFQAGLSWITILKKRDNFRRAFAGFDPEQVSRFGKRDINRLLNDAGIVRNRLKINAAVNNAKCFLQVQKESGSFDRYIWQFTDYKTLRSKEDLTEKTMPVNTAESEAMSRDLKMRGFKFVGPTVCYAYMQAIGMVDDHVKGCFKYKKGLLK